MIFFYFNVLEQKKKKTFFIVINNVLSIVINIQKITEPVILTGFYTSVIYINHNKKNFSIWQNCFSLITQCVVMP